MKSQEVQTRLRRRQFIKHTSLVVGASVFTGPYLLQGKNGNELQGAVLSGAGASAAPLPGARVSLYEASSSAPKLLGSASTNATGNFSLRVSSGGRTSKGIFYATADLAPGLQLVAVLGPSLPGFVTLNEMTT